MAKRMTKAERAMEEKANRVATRACDGYQVGIMDLSRIHNEAKEAISLGQDEEQAIATVTAFVKTIAK